MKTLLVGCIALWAEHGAGSEGVSFSRDIRPILSENCFECHGPDANAVEADLRLDVRSSAVGKLDGGRRAIVPGRSGASELLARVTADDPDDVMPPSRTGKSLSDAQVALLRRWIDDGAEYERLWSFVPPKRPVVPRLLNVSNAANPIDSFIADRLDREGMAMSPQADRSVLIRRVTLALTGLPPTPREVDRFVQDHTPNAYERLVDRLLDSPRYGEWMARPWLDAARYADTNGYNNDETRTMWPWRDWVIDAYNRNLPYDRFVTEQLAGDLLPNPNLDQLIATGFNRNHVLTTEGGIFEQEYRVEYIADRVHTTATVFMGLSFQCARCHDHKFDPITQVDFFRFYAFFNTMPDGIVTFGKPIVMAEPMVEVPTPEQAEMLKRLLLRRMAIHSSSVGAGVSAPWFAASAAIILRDELELRDEIVKTMVMRDMVVRPTHVLDRGEYDKPLDVVAAGVPDSLPSMPSGTPINRLGLSQWLTDDAHPLTARVAVNRIWHQLFGAGLVETVEDFGSQGTWPSHPQLLDWLATELIRNGWDVKRLQRLIVTSAAFQQSSDLSERLLERDPTNRLLARGPRYRLSAEAVRDGALAMSGLLIGKIGGPSVKPYQPPGLWEDVSVLRQARYEADTGPGLYRRSLYTFWKRTSPPPSMTTFDAPDRESCVIRRARTNTPLQALVLMNDPTFVEASRKIAERALREGGDSDETQLRFVSKLVLSRSPSRLEESELLLFLREARSRFESDPSAASGLLETGASAVDSSLDRVELAAWTSVASLLLNLDETVTLP